MFAKRDHLPTHPKDHTPAHVAEFHFFLLSTRWHSLHSTRTLARTGWLGPLPRRPRWRSARGLSWWWSSRHRAIGGQEIRGPSPHWRRRPAVRRRELCQIYRRNCKNKL